MRRIVLMALALHPLFFVSTGWGAMLERNVPVSVSIVVNQGSSDLEIVADKNSFTVIYDIATQRFFPLSIPFKVRSVSGQSVNYELSIPQLAGQCDGGATQLQLSTTLDGLGIVLNEKRRAAGIENSHLIEVTFPSLPQKDVVQQCEGSVSVVAELVI